MKASESVSEVLTPERPTPAFLSAPGPCRTSATPPIAGAQVRHDQHPWSHHAESFAALSLGQTDFSALRRSGAVYVDKTDLIFRLAGEDAGRIFLTRPKGFGKTLLLSTIESLFRHGLRDFQGLAVEGLWTDRTYDVLRLDFGTLGPFASAEDFSTAFDALITAAADDAGLEIPRDAGGPIARLAKWIAAREDASLVLLIDDYDAPFLRAWKDEKLFAEAEAQLGRFYAYLKSMEEKFRFLFITGTTRVTGAWLTSPMNGLQDVTFDPAYAALAGFTEDEFETAFRVRLNRAAKAKRVTRGELVGTVCGQCGGYSFDEAASTRLCSPEAAMTFLLTVAGGFAIRPKPLGEAQDLLDHLLGKADCRLFNGDLVMPMAVLVERVGPGDASPAALAFQLGFLTVGERVTPELLRLHVPNAQAMRRVLECSAAVRPDE